MVDAFQQIQQISKGYQASCILGAACELNLFSVLIQAEQPLSSEELSRRLRWDVRGTKVLLDALCSLSLLFQTDGKYSVLPEFREILDENHPQTMVPMIRHSMSCLRQWSQLAWTVKAGIPAPSHNSLLGARQDNRSFVLGMHSLAVRMIPRLMEKMQEAGILSFRKVLDLGGASGSWLWAFLEINPASEGVLLDLPPAIREAEKRFQGTPLEPRTTFVAGNFYEMEYPSGVDFLWISAIIHQQDSAATLEMFRKSYRALESGGKIVIRDIFYPAEQTPPSPAAFFAVNMLCNTASGKVYTVEETLELLEKAGFRNPRRVVEAVDMGSIIIAEK